MLDRLKGILLKPSTQAGFAATIAFAVYVRTMAPTVMWYDMGEFATAAYVLGIAHNTGYPLYILLGKLFTFLPIGDIAYRVNLMSAFFGALTVMMMFLIVYQLTQNKLAAWVSGLTIAFSSTLWANATWAVSYDLNAFLTLLILILLIRWTELGKKSLFYWAAFTLGLSLGNHRLILVLVPTMIYLFWHGNPSRSIRRDWKFIGALGLFFLLGFSVNLYLPIRAMQDPLYMWADASNLDVFVEMVFTGAADRSAFVNPFESMQMMQGIFTFLFLHPVYEFTIPGLLIAVIGVAFLWKEKPPYLIAASLIFVSTLVMISIYGIHNIFNYFQPIYLMIAIWLGCGVAWVMPRAIARILHLKDGTDWVQGMSRVVKIASLIWLILPLFLLTRNFSRLDRSTHWDAKDFADYVLSTVEEYSVVLTDFWTWAPLHYAQVIEGKGQHVWVDAVLSNPSLDLDKVIVELLDAGAPVYVARRWEDTPEDETEGYVLQLLAPYVIHSMTTELRPLPEYKDLLVPRGALFKALRKIQDLEVGGVPIEHRLELRFGDDLLLSGFHVDPQTIQFGEAFHVTYYWTLGRAMDQDYWVDVLFTDEAGNVATIQKIPSWLHSHWIGGGSFPTSGWEPDLIIRERYDGLVPNRVPPGVYDIRAIVYTTDDRTEPLLVEGEVFPDKGVLLGRIRVEE